MSSTYRVTVLAADGSEAADGSPVSEELRRRVSAWWGAALAWQRDHAALVKEGGGTEGSLEESRSADKEGAA